MMISFSPYGRHVYMYVVCGGSCYVAQASSEMEPLLSAETNYSQGSRGLERWSVSFKVTQLAQEEAVV